MTFGSYHAEPGDRLRLARVVLGVEHAVGEPREEVASGGRVSQGSHINWALR